MENLRLHKRLQRQRRLIAILGFVIVAIVILALNVENFIEIHFRNDFLHAIKSSMEYPLTAMIVGVLFTAALVSIVDLVAGRLPESSESERVLEEFYYAAKKEITRYIGYYRSHSIVHIGPIDENGNLKFVMESRIHGVGNAEIRGIRDVSKTGGESNKFKRSHSWFDRPENGKDDVELELKYEIDDQELKGYSSVIYIENGERRSERLEANYKNCLKDDHIWNSPVFGGFTVYFELPGYECQVHVIRGSKEERVDGAKNFFGGTKKFSYDDSLFTHQGFSWSIKKKEKKK